jgi:hypothetical protein
LWQWQITINRKIFGSAHANTTTVLDLFLNGFISTLSMPICIDHHHRRARSRCLLNCKEMVLLYLKSGCYTLISCQATKRSVFAFFMPLGCIHWRQMRESPMSLPRFNIEDFFELSSVMLPPDLQLNPQPQSCLPTQLLVEPLALRLVRFQEALGEDNCRFFCSNSHWTPWQAPVVLFGIDSVHFTVVPLLGVHLGTYFISDFLTSSYMSYVVSFCYF